MERNFQEMLIGGEGSGVDSPDLAADDSCINGMYSGMSFQSLLSLNQKKALLPLLDDPYGTTSITEPMTFGFFGDYFPAIQSNQLGECSTDGDRKLKMPKREPLNLGEVNDVSTEPFNFISEHLDPNLSLYGSSFHQLPDLRSLEQLQDGLAIAESTRKRVKSISPPPPFDPYIEPPVFKNFQISNYFAAYKTAAEAPPAMPQSVLAGKRRQSISDKTRSLQKLLPWDTKMEKATMLEEAYKYIKFLQAQISVLQSMPSDSSSFVTQNGGNVNLLCGLGSLNRQQLLQVLVNSPVAQTILSSQGWCVYSIEQLVLLKEIAERKVAYQQMVFDPSLLS